MPSKIELQGVFHFLWLKKQRPTEIYRDISETYGSNHLIFRHTIGKWCKPFENSSTGVTDEHR